MEGEQVRFRMEQEIIKAMYPDNIFQTPGCGSENELLFSNNVAEYLEDLLSFLQGYPTNYIKVQKWMARRRTMQQVILPLIRTLSRGTGKIASTLFAQLVRCLVHLSQPTNYDGEINQYFQCFKSEFLKDDTGIWKMVIGCMNEILNLSKINQFHLDTMRYCLAVIINVFRLSLEAPESEFIEDLIILQKAFENGLGNTIARITERSELNSVAVELSQLLSFIYKDDSQTDISCRSQNKGVVIFTELFVQYGRGNILKSLGEILLNSEQPESEYVETLFLWVASRFKPLIVASSHDRCTQKQKEMKHIETIMNIAVNLCENSRVLSEVSVINYENICTALHLISPMIFNEKSKVLYQHIQDIPNMICLLVLLMRYYRPAIHDISCFIQLVGIHHIVMGCLEEYIQVGQNLEYDWQQHIQEFANDDMMIKFGLALEACDMNNEIQQESMFTMLHHIASDVRGLETLYQLELFLAFDKLLENPSKLNPDFRNVIHYITESFIASVIENPGKYCPVKELHVLQKKQYTRCIFASLQQNWTNGQMET